MMQPIALHSLDQLSSGQSAYINKIHLDGTIRRRILDLGFIPGTHVECVRHSPCGNPRAYFIRGTTIAIRNEDAAKIEIHPYEEKYYGK